jgi:hypothetical protein
LMQRARGGTAARLGKQGVVAAERDDGEVRGGGATADDDARRGRRWPEPTPIEDRVPGWGRAQGSTRVKSNWGERKSTSRQSSSPSRRRLGGPVMAGGNRRGGRGHESMSVREDKRRRGKRVRVSRSGPARLAGPAHWRIWSIIIIFSLFSFPYKILSLKD